jgi:Zn-dependent alcohol dehydrogenases, class III
VVIASHEFGLEPCRPPTPAGTAVEIPRIIVELNAAQVRPGQVVIVIGVGGIGINAVQGAKHAGAGRIIAVTRRVPSARARSSWARPMLSAP